MALKLITAPTSEPITRLEAKYHCRLITDVTDASVNPDDAYIDSLIVAARMGAEQITGRSLMPQTWELALDEFEDEILLPRAPVVSITTVRYLDESGVLQTLAANQYQLDDYSTPPALVPAYDVVYPATRDQRNAVLIKYLAGYATAALVPQEIKSWMLLCIGTLYENRETVIAGQPLHAMPYADRLLDSSKVWGA